MLSINFLHKKNIEDVIISKFDCYNARGSFQDMLQYLTSEYKVLFLSIYTVDGSNFSNYFNLSIKNKTTSAEASSIESIESHNYIGGGLVPEENLDKLFYSSNADQPFKQNFPDKIIISEELKQVRSIDTYVNSVSYPLKINGDIIGLILFECESAGWAKKMIKALSGLSHILAATFYYSLKEERDGLVRKNDRLNSDLKMVSLESLVSLKVTTELLLKQCINRIDFNTAILMSCESDGDFFVEYFWSKESFTPCREFLREIIVSESIGNLNSFSPSDQDVLEKHNIKSIFIFPVGDEKNRQIILISNKASKVLTSEMTKQLYMFSKVLKRILKTSDIIGAFQSQFYESLDLIIEIYESSSPYLAGHHGRVIDVVSVFCETYPALINNKSDLLLAARFHDIGMISMSENILTVLAFQHPGVGAHMLSSIDQKGNIGRYVLEHHESFDGFGFPKSLKGDEISVEGQVLAIAEDFVEKTTNSKASGALSLSEYKSYLREHEDGKFSKAIITKFIQVIESIYGSSSKIPDCQKIKSCPDSICNNCEVKSIGKNCWEVKPELRNCSQHGDFNCNSCFVFKSWSGGG